MAGYDGYSKSNNAVAAEDAGMMTATALAKVLKCKGGAVKALLTPAEWHHTSNHFSVTNYYEAPEDEETLAALHAWKPDGAQHFEGCTVEYLTWGGSRKHPVPTEHKHTDVAVTRKGSFFTFHLDGGDVRKKISSNGTYVWAAEGPMVN